ncbi:hypothetical protein BQ8482_340202 [Mesorhizobium delmotii]|uniref:Uncharacterized protein n=1 Tax=Mesorhizobium delmotii TaxID=1631247 RepID=A0A2P9AQC3_9HYPH|nr:hypothetical protein BQ8482_340202 [Mesorhizobium delmotii]
MDRETLQRFQDELVAVLLTGAEPRDTDTLSLLSTVDAVRFRMLSEMVAGKRIAKCRYILPRTFQIGEFTPEFLNRFCATMPFISADFYSNAAQFYFFVRRESRFGSVPPILEEACFTELAIASNTRRPVLASEGFPIDSWDRYHWGIPKGVRLRRYTHDVFSVLSTGAVHLGRRRYWYGIICKPRNSRLGACFAPSAATYDLLRRLGRRGGKAPAHLNTPSGTLLMKWLYEAGIIEFSACASV